MNDRMLSAADVAAYLLDRADQYDAESGCHVALADAAHNVWLGEVEAAKANGDLDAALHKRLRRMTGQPKPVDPTMGVDED